MRNPVRAVLVSLVAFALTACMAVSLLVVSGDARAPRFNTGVILLAIGSAGLVVYEMSVLAPLLILSSARAHRATAAAVGVLGSWLPILLVTLLLGESDDSRTFVEIVAYAISMPGELFVWLVPYAVASGAFAWLAASRVRQSDQPQT